MVTKIDSKNYTLEEYLELDQNSDERLEYWHGEVFSMSGVGRNHARIEVNLTTRLTILLAGQRCEVFPANMRIRVPSLPPYRYADLSALFGEAQFEKIGGVDVLVNPSMIIEVLSETTEAYDRGEKFTHYKGIPSFGEYLLVAQNRPHITHLTRQPGGAWVYNEYNDPAATLELITLSCELKMTEVYENIAFTPDARLL